MNDGAKKQLDEILAKPVEMLNEYDISILRARSSYLTEEESEKYSEVLGGKKVIEVSEEKPVKKAKKKIIK